MLVSAGDVASKATECIEELAQRIEDAPTFAPHVTLLGGVQKPQAEVLRITEELARDIQVGSLTGFAGHK